LNDHAYILYKRKDCKYDINLRWFIYKYQSLFYQFSSFSDNGTWNKTDFFNYAKIDIPEIDDQLSMLNRYKKLDIINEEIIKIQSFIEKILNKQLVVNSQPEQQVFLSEIMSHISRNDSLSEQGIYRRSGDIKRVKEKIKVISGSTDDYYGFVPLEKKLHYIKDRPCLQVVTRGKAGKIKFHPTGVYATNTNSMLLVIREDKKSLLGIETQSEEESYLKFLECYLASLFNEYCSSADVAVFPLTEIIDKIRIPLFRYSPIIKKIIEKYEILNKYKVSLHEISECITETLDKEIT